MEGKWFIQDWWSITKKQMASSHSKVKNTKNIYRSDGQVTVELFAVLPDGY